MLLWNMQSYFTQVKPNSVNAIFQMEPPDEIFPSPHEILTSIHEIMSSSHEKIALPHELYIFYLLSGDLFRKLIIIIDVRTVKFDHHTLTTGWSRGIYLTPNYFIVFSTQF